MKYCIALFTILMNNSISFGQTMSVGLKDSLESYYRNGEYEKYLKLIRAAEEKMNTDTLFEPQMKVFLSYIMRKMSLSDPIIKFQLRKTYCYHANIYKKRSEYSKALPFYLKAHELVEDKICLDTFSIYVENVLATIYTRLDNFERSNYFGELLMNSLEYNGNSQFMARSYVNLATNYVSSKNIYKAIEQYQKGILLSKKINYPRGIYSNEFGLAEVYISIDKLDSVKILLNSCAKILPSIVNEKNYLEYKAGLYNLFSVLFEKKLDWRSSIYWRKTAIDTLSKNYIKTPYIRELAKQYNSLSDLYLANLQLDSAIYYYVKGLHCLLPKSNVSFQLPDQNTLYQENTFIQLFSSRAHICAEKYKLDPKFEYINEELKTYEYIFGLASNTIDNILGDQTKLISIQENKLYIGQSLHCFQELLKYEKLDELFPRIRTIFNDSKALLVDQKIQDRFKFESLSVRDQEQVRSLYKQRKSYIELNNSNSTIAINNLMEISRILNEKSKNSTSSKVSDQYIEYSFQADSIFVLAQLGAYKLFKCLGSKKEFDILYLRFQREMNPIFHNQDSSIFTELSNFLLSEIQTHLNSDIVIIPDGPIAYLPFEALRLRDGSYLLDKHNIHYQLSYSQSSFHSDHTYANSSISLLSPSYEKNDAIAFERGSSFELKYAVQECKNILDQFRSGKELSDTIHKANLLETIQDNTRIFHFAGHGKMTRDSSYLILAQGGEKIFYEDISTLYNNLDLVVLSACETGLGKWDPGDGSRSMAKAFIESGSKSVVSSLWNVNDYSGSEIITQFYKNLILGQTKSESLRQSKLDFLHKASLEYRHPYYWATFVAIGDMNSMHFPGDFEIFYNTISATGVTLFLLSIIALVFIYCKIKTNSNKSSS